MANFSNRNLGKMCGARRNCVGCDHNWDGWCKKCKTWSRLVSNYQCKNGLKEVNEPKPKCSGLSSYVHSRLLEYIGDNEHSIKSLAACMSVNRNTLSIVINDASRAGNQTVERIEKFLSKEGVL